LKFFKINLRLFVRSTPFNPANCFFNPSFVIDPVFSFGLFLPPNFLPFFCGGGLTFGGNLGLPLGRLGLGGGFLGFGLIILLPLALNFFCGGLVNSLFF